MSAKNRTLFEPLDTAVIERLRHSFRPDRITTLFVGESAPIGGTFFYDGNSQLYRYMRAAFDGRDDFLTEFKAKGFFLDDLVLLPVNHLTPSKRFELHRKWQPSLALRISEYRPLAVVSMMIGIKEVVEGAVAMAGLLNVSHYAVPFAGNGQQLRFRQEMSRILPLLPMAKASEPRGNSGMSPIGSG